MDIKIMEPSPEKLHEPATLLIKSNYVPEPFTCAVCKQEKPDREKAGLVYTDTQEPLGPVMCGQCMQNGILWAAIQAHRQKGE